MPVRHLYIRLDRDMLVLVFKQQKQTTSTTHTFALAEKQQDKRQYRDGDTNVGSTALIRSSILRISMSYGRKSSVRNKGHRISDIVSNHSSFRKCH